MKTKRQNYIGWLHGNASKCIPTGTQKKVLTLPSSVSQHCLAMITFPQPSASLSTE